MFSFWALFIYTCLLQTLLVGLHQHTSLQKRANRLALIWGAQPASRFWAAATLDSLTTFLLGTLIFQVTPGPAGPAAYEAFHALLPWLALAALCNVAAHASFDQHPRYWGIAVFLGCGAVAAALTGVYLALGGDIGSLQYQQVLRQVYAPALLLALSFVLVRWLSAGLRAIPILGDFCYASAYHGALLALYAIYGQQVAAAAGLGSPPGPGPQLYGLVVPFSLLAAGVTLWLPGPTRQKHASDPPRPVTNAAAQYVHAAAAENGNHTHLTAGQWRIAIQRQPFQLNIFAAGQPILSLDAASLYPVVILDRWLSISLPWQPAHLHRLSYQVKRPMALTVHNITLDGDALLISLGGLELRVFFYNQDVVHLQVQRRFPSQAAMPHTAWQRRLHAVRQRSRAAWRAFTARFYGLGVSWNLQADEKLPGFSGRSTAPALLSQHVAGRATQFLAAAYQPLDWRLSQAGRLSLHILADRLDLYLSAGSDQQQAAQPIAALVSHLPKPYWPPLNARSTEAQLSPAIALDNPAYREGARLGYFILNQLGLPYIQRHAARPVAMIDYTNPRACAWYAAMITESGPDSLPPGTSAPLPPDCMMCSGHSGLALWSLYPLLHLRAAHRSAAQQT